MLKAISGNRQPRLDKLPESPFSVKLRAALGELCVTKEGGRVSTGVDACGSKLKAKEAQHRAGQPIEYKAMMEVAKFSFLLDDTQKGICTALLHGATNAVPVAAAVVEDAKKKIKAPKAVVDTRSMVKSLFKK